jgi:hypothetical protein
VKKALRYLDCLELNGRGLLYIPHGGDWADEYINHGYVLFDQILRYIALKNYHSVTKNKDVGKQMRKLAKLIDTNYFPNKKADTKYIYNETKWKRSLKEYKPPFPITYFTSHSIRYHVDNFASALVLHSHILDKKRHKSIQDTTIKRFLSKAPILPAFDPVFKRGHHQWEHLKRNNLYKFRNKPHEYHNGGLWPLVHGFFLSTLANSHPKVAQKKLSEFAQKLKDDNYSFPEFYHAKTKKACGTRNLGFSASAYILAYTAIEKNQQAIIR